MTRGTPRPGKPSRERACNHAGARRRLAHERLEPTLAPQRAPVGRAEAAAGGDRRIAELQDSMLPIESGDGELRAGLAEVRELLKQVPGAAREFLRTLGR